AVASFRLRKNRRTLLVGAPCFSRGSWTLSPAEKRSLLKLALAAGFAETSAKAQDQSRDFSRSAKALLPPHKCGGPHREVHSLDFVQHFSAARHRAKKSAGANPTSLQPLLPRVKRKRIWVSRRRMTCDSSAGVASISISATAEPPFLSDV